MSPRALPSPAVNEASFLEEIVRKGNVRCLDVFEKGSCSVLLGWRERGVDASEIFEEVQPETDVMAEIIVQKIVDTASHLVDGVCASDRKNFVVIVKSNQVRVKALVLAGFISQPWTVEANIEAFERRRSKKILSRSVVDVVKVRFVRMVEIVTLDFEVSLLFF